MAPSRAPRPQARLLRTYGGRRRAGRGPRGAPAPWFSPARERRRLFSSSSSGLSAGSPGPGSSGAGSPASGPDSDPDFEPLPARGSVGPALRGLRTRLRARRPPGALEEEEEEEEEEGEEGEEEEEEQEEQEEQQQLAKENRLHRHVTERSWKLRARGRRPGPPLCSTPGPPPPTAAPSPGRTPPAARPRLSRSILARLSPVPNLSLEPEPGQAGDSLATSASLFSPASAPPKALPKALPEEPRGRPRRQAAKPALATPACPRGPPQGTARKACISGFSSARWKRSRPPQTGPRRKVPLGQKHPTEGWAQARASLSFHKKVVAELQPPGTPCSSLLLDSFGAPGGTPWQTSSMYMLTPNKSLPTAEMVLSDAEKVYRECQQEGPLTFDHYLSRDRIQSCEKIGEGVFGEVFRAVVGSRTMALKVIAIEGEALVNGSPQKTFGEILPEIIISKELSLLSEEAPNRTEGFIGLYSVRCVQGPYPDLLLRAWDAFHLQQDSENERPDCFGPEQLYVVLEFEFGGVDLEHMRKQLSSVATAKSLLHQVTAALAVAEAALRFEHRDLHWGNVLVKKTSAKELGYTLDGQAGTIATHGIHVNIIDYTLSRLEKDGLVVFCDISQEQELFQGQGDYQFEIYRLMKKRTRNHWAPYQPYSNVLWLHYLADKVLKEMTFKKKVLTGPMRQVRQQIQAFHESVLGFESATELLQSHSLFR
ncbi:serine/threonine-protein kinase haspin [Macrotis lagotis]|uniref:serine/threonine-protein kinase haspin n=1 Tax=Macrotis lagotis TaxID=92651 RepID=UPI003D69380F